MNRLALLCLLVAGCWSTAAQTTEPPQNPTAGADVAVELSAVTLGDDCGGHGRIPPPPKSTILAQAQTPAQAPARTAPAKGPMPPAEAPMPCAVGANCGFAPSNMGCDQTSMQLAIKATGGSKPTTIKVKLVELLDDNGKVLAALTTQQASRWSTDAYVDWDETVAPGQMLAASYALSSPDWNVVSDGRWNAHNKSYQLRVTLTINDKDRTFDKQSITPAMLEPPVPT